MSFICPYLRLTDEGKGASIRQLSNSLFVFRKGPVWNFHLGTYGSDSDSGRTAFIRLWSARYGTPARCGFAVRLRGGPYMFIYEVYNDQQVNRESCRGRGDNVRNGQDWRSCRL